MINQLGVYFYKLEKLKFDVIECKQRSLSYSAALKADMIIAHIDAEEDKQILSAKEQVFIGDLPLMTLAQHL